jgi:hypothetical protein
MKLPKVGEWYELKKKNSYLYVKRANKDRVGIDTYIKNRRGQFIKFGKTMSIDPVVWGGLKPLFTKVTNAALLAKLMLLL